MGIEGEKKKKTGVGVKTWSFLFTLPLISLKRLIPETSSGLFILVSLSNRSANFLPQLKVDYRAQVLIKKIDWKQ